MPFTWAPGFRSLPSNTGEVAVVAAVITSASAIASSGERAATIFVLNLSANFSLMALAKASAFSKVRQ